MLDARCLVLDDGLPEPQLHDDHQEVTQRKYVGPTVSSDDEVDYLIKVAEASPYKAGGPPPCPPTVEQPEEDTLTKEPYPTGSVSTCASVDNIENNAEDRSSTEEEVEDEERIKSVNDVASPPEPEAEVARNETEGLDLNQEPKIRRSTRSTAGKH